MPSLTFLRKDGGVSYFARLCGRSLTLFLTVHGHALTSVKQMKTGLTTWALNSITDYRNRPSLDIQLNTVTFLRLPELLHIEQDQGISKLIMGQSMLKICQYSNFVPYCVQSQNYC